MALFGLFKKRDAGLKEEMSFIDHLDALRGHLIRALIAIVIGAIVVAVYNEYIVKKIVLGPTKKDFYTYTALCNAGHSFGLGDKLCMQEIKVSFQNTDPSGQFNMYFTIIIIGGLIVAFPYVFYEFWKFVKPALTKKELNKTRGVIFWVSLLFFLGVLFGYFVIAPYTINFFATFTLDESIQNIWTISNYIDTITPLILGTGLAFQMPLVMYFLAKVGVISASLLRKVRRYAVVIILIVAGIITPPDVVSQIIVTIPLLLLYEISIWLAARVEKENKKKEEEEWS
jgi:sec-independent protein translocase protein TatC